MKKIHLAYVKIHSVDLGSNVSIGKTDVGRKMTDLKENIGFYQAGDGVKSTKIHTKILDQDFSDGNDHNY